MTSQDTLKINKALLEEIRNSGDYDYGRELVAPDYNVLERLYIELNSYIHDLFSTDTMVYLEPKFWLLVAILMLVGAVAFYLIKRPELFRRSAKEAPLDYEVTEDTIYGIDFEAETGKAVARSDWREAVRLNYLQTLRWLSDHEKIDWRPSKTPTQYTREMATEEFRQLTLHFMRVRYGDFKATKELYEECRGLASQCVEAQEEGGEAS